MDHTSHERCGAICGCSMRRLGAPAPSRLSNFLEGNVFKAGELLKCEPRRRLPLSTRKVAIGATVQYRDSSVPRRQLPNVSGDVCTSDFHRFYSWEICSYWRENWLQRCLSFLNQAVLTTMRPMLPAGLQELPASGMQVNPCRNRWIERRHEFRNQLSRRSPTVQFRPSQVVSTG